MNLKDIFREALTYIPHASPNDMLDALNSAIRQINYPNKVRTYANVAVTLGREFDIPSGITTISNVFLNGKSIDMTLSYRQWKENTEQGFGGTDTVLSVTNPSGGIFRYTWSSGTPFYLEEDNFGNNDDIIIVGGVFDSRNTGLFPVVSYGGTVGVDEYFEVTNAYGVPEPSITLGSTGSIRGLNEGFNNACCITSGRKILFLKDLFDASDADQKADKLVIYGSVKITELSSFGNTVSLDVEDYWAEYIKHYMLMVLYSMPSYENLELVSYRERMKNDQYRIAYSTHTKEMKSWVNRGIYADYLSYSSGALL